MLLVEIWNFFLIPLIQCPIFFFSGKFSRYAENLLRKVVIKLTFLRGM